MLTQLSTVKTRLALAVTDYDGILTNCQRALKSSQGWADENQPL